MLPMLMEIDFSSVKSIKRAPSAGIVTAIANWLVKPFTGYAIGVLFFRYIYTSEIDESTQRQYVAGTVALTAAPCTAMVFVWSKLVEVRWLPLCCILLHEDTVTIEFLISRSAFRRVTHRLQLRKLLSTTLSFWLCTLQSSVG